MAEPGAFTFHPSGRTDIGKGLKYHTAVAQVLHRDIKTMNIFLDDQLNPLLGDLGVSKVRAHRASSPRAHCRTHADA